MIGARAAAAAPAGAALQPLRHVCPNGLVLLLLAKSDLPLVAAEAYIPAGQTFEPAAQAGVAALTGRMLTEGTQRRSGLQIASGIEQVGGELGTHSVGGWFEVCAGDLALGLELLRDCLYSPKFPAAQFRKEKSKQLAAIAAEQDDPQRVARQAFDQAVYRKHPFSRPVHGFAQTVSRTKRANCQAHHRKFFSPDRTILALAGDFDPAALAERIDRDWGGLPCSPAPRVRIARVVRQRARREVRVSLARRQCHILLGHLGVRRNHPDFYRLQVADHILGMGSGFTDRLSRTLRDELGLAYTVYASITSSAQAEPGAFHAYIGTSPQHEQAAVDGVLSQMRRIRDEPVGEEELAGAKAYLTGSFAFKFETTRQLCSYLVRQERFALGDYRNEYPRWIDQVSAADVQRVAREQLDPEHYTLAVAGPARQR